jgi:hypothetical protein
MYSFILFGYFWKKYNQSELLNKLDNNSDLLFQPFHRLVDGLDHFLV